MYENMYKVIDFSMNIFCYYALYTKITSLNCYDCIKVFFFLFIAKQRKFIENILNIGKYFANLEI